MTKKPQDLTLRNLRAQKTREAAMQTALTLRIKNVDLNLASWLLSLEARIEKLESRGQ